MAEAGNSREDFIYMARLSEQAERYDEMADAIKKVAQLHLELTVEERNLFSISYKHHMGARRSSLFILNSILQKEQSRGSSSSRISSIISYQSKVLNEMNGIYNELIHIIDNDLLPFSSNNEAHVFYNKMKGDYHRYKSEYSLNSERENATRLSFQSYNHATNIAHAHLHPTHPIRLGLALNFSVFYHEILNDPQKSKEIAKQAFDEAISRLDELSEDSYKDSTLIMQLMRDGVTLWSPDGEDERRTTS